MTRPQRWLPACFLGLWALTFAPGARPQTEAAPEPLRPLWERALPMVIGVALSPDGSRVAALDRGGHLGCFDVTGRLLWDAPAPGADSLLVGAGGSPLLAYGVRQPLRTTITRFGPDGRRLPPLEAGRPVTGAALSADGQQILVGTTGGALWFRETAGGTVRTEYPLAGGVRQVHFGPANTFFSASAGADSVRCFHRDGRELWHARGPGARDCLLSVSAGGGLLATVGPSLRTAETITLALRQADGALLWETSWPGRLPRPRMVPNGSAVLVAYEQPEALGASTRYERRLACFPVDRAASPRWATGGAYTGASLFAATDPDGRFTVSLDMALRTGQTSLRLLSDTGQRLLTYPCPSAIRIAAASADGSRVAVYRTDGQLALIQVL